MTAISISFDIGGVEMRRYDMDAFLTEICECCDRISASRSCYDIDDSQIRNLKREIEDFSIANKDTILSMYRYAEVGGKYQYVLATDLSAAMLKYEEYHDDLMEFIKKMLSKESEKRGIEESLEYCRRASQVDKKIQNELFGEPEKVLFPRTLESLEMIMALSVFCDKVSDNFIFLSQKNQVISPRVRWLIDLYVSSVTEFTTRMLKEYVSLFNNLKEVAINGVKPEIDVISEFRLF